jgi:hypothetical protein
LIRYPITVKLYNVDNAIPSLYGFNMIPHLYARMKNCKNEPIAKTRGYIGLTCFIIRITWEILTFLKKKNSNARDIVKITMNFMYFMGYIVLFFNDIVNFFCFLFKINIYKLKYLLFYF